jgi:5-methyltetrahydrofolate--homocysteine methyltransferase
MSRFLDALRSKQVLLMDGAMGTQLQRAGARESECLELWNLTHPDRVRAVHRSYVDAGAVCLVTNTFQSNPPALAKHDLASKMEDINHAAVSIARSVSSQCFILGSIGPIADHSTVGVHRLPQALRGCDALLVETCSDDRELTNVHSVIADLPTLVSFAFLRNPAGELTTSAGLTPEVCANLAEQHHVAALGVNCGRDIGMKDMIEIVRRYRKATDLPLFARPNAGTPTKLEVEWVYPHSPKQMAASLPDLLEAGVAMVGGCCGTTPEHIAAFRPIIERWNAAGSL